MFGAVASVAKSSGRLRFWVGKSGVSISSISRTFAELIDDREDSSSEKVSG